MKLLFRKACRLLIDLIAAPYISNIQGNLWSKRTSYYEWRLLGSARLIEFISYPRTCQEFSFEELTEPFHFNWVLETISKKDGLLTNFLNTNGWIVTSRTHLEFLRLWLFYGCNNKKIASDALRGLLSNQHIGWYVYKIFRDNIDWTNPFFYERFPRRLIEIDLGSDYDEFANRIDWKLASRYFNFLNDRNLKDFKSNLCLEELLKNPNVNREDIADVFQESANPHVELGIDKLPDGAVSITDVIYKVGDELWIKKENKYYPDINYDNF